MRLNVVIRFTNSLSASEQVPDLSIPLSINYDVDDVNKLVNVVWLKTTIRSKVPQCANKRLRLIYNGRVLNEKTDFKKEVLKPQLNLDQIYIHCVIGDELTREQLAQENQLDNKPQEVSTNPEVIGFDRLLQQGFSQDDVTDLRRQFLLIYGSDNTSSGGDIADVEEEEHRQNRLRQLEERWIESISNNEAAGTANEQTPLTQDGDQAQAATTPSQPMDLDESRVNEDLLLGFCVGVFLGIISVVFLLADDSVFNKRQKMSIIAGLFINFSLAIVRGQWI